MSPVTEKMMQFGINEFIEIDCFTCKRPTILFHRGFGQKTDEWPPEEAISEARYIAGEHDENHAVTIFIGKGSQRVGRIA